MEKLKLLKTLSTIILIAVASSIFSFGAANNASAAGGIIINEIQLLPIGERFIELYNPNDSAVNLTNWYIQRKTQSGDSFGSLISKTNFENKTINARDYFLISRGSLNNADIVLNDLTLTESNAIQIKNSDGDIIDKVGWGNSSDCETNCAIEPVSSQSIQKTSNGEWIIAAPTPRAANSAVSAITNGNTNTSGNLNTNTNSNSNSNTNINETIKTSILTSIIFNEVYPNPPDESTEFIELKNISGLAGSPAGWKIKDAAGDEYAMPDKEIADGALWVIPKLESGTSLNNDGETLSLINPAGAISATLSIPAAPESQSYARSGAESFEWTATLTAGAENIFTQTVSAPAEIAAPVNTNSTASNVNASNSNSSVNANANTNANINSPKITTDFSAIKLSELMPNPEGDDADGEWIELYNGGDKEIDLAGGSLSDASGKIYAIPKNTIISAKSYKVFYRKQTGIVLNNDQDTIDLKDSSGKKIDSISYADGSEGKSYSRTNSGWQWSSPTPEKANSQSAETNANANGNTNSSAIKRIGSTINEAKNSKSRSIITVSGIVTAALGEISKNAFYIQDETGGIAVVLESGALEISRGDFAVIKGKIKTSSGEKILSAENEKQITVQSSGNNAAAWQMNIADIDSQSLGLFIGVNGKAVQLNDNGLVIDDGSGSLAILLPTGTNAEKDQMASVQGILKKTKDGIVLVLRDKNDFISGNVLGESDQKDLSIAGNGKKYDIIIQLLIIIVTLLVGGYAARKYLQKYSYATSDTKPAEESKEDRDSNSGFGI